RQPVARRQRRPRTPSGRVQHTTSTYSSWVCELEMGDGGDSRVLTDEHERHDVAPVPVDRIAADVFNCALVVRRPDGQLQPIALAQMHVDLLAWSETPAGEGDYRAGRALVCRQLGG